MAKKILTIVFAIALIAVIGFLYNLTLKRDKSEKQFLDEKTNEYREEVKKQQAENDEYEKSQTELLENIPGIVCWGDDMTAGQGSAGITYPEVLKKCLTADGIDIPVVNMGIADENSLEVLGRAGAIPFVVAEEMTLAGNGYVSKFELKNTRGDSVHPLMHTNNPGVNPVKVNGIDCTFYGNIISYTDYSANGYYLSKATPGDDVVIPAGSVIETAGMAYSDYISILCVGQHGGYKNTDDLISQIDTFIGKLGKNKDKYIILGYAAGSTESNSAVETALLQKYGEHYLNTRDYMVNNGLEDAKITPSDEDKKDVEKGIVPSSLRSDENNLNNNGYSVLGNLVYNKLCELGYI